MKMSRKNILMVMLASAMLQLMIISYNNYTGFIHIKSAAEFMIRWFLGSTMSSVWAMLALSLDFAFINRLENRLAWEDNVSLRAIAEGFFTVMAGIFIGTTITLFSHAFMPYKNPLMSIIVTNSLISVIINVIVITLIEAVRWYKRGVEAKFLAEKLEKENSVIRLEVLKHQLDPHFLFNSLNVLHALIEKDTKRAQDFLSEFSYVYRYTLDVIDKPVVTLKEELAYARAYLYLQGIRFGDAVSVKIDVEASKLQCLVPPLSVQTLLENVFKHNKATAGSPLCISILSDGDSLLVMNNLQMKAADKYSSKVGLANLTKRYKFVAGVVPEFTMTENMYRARLPLISED